MRYLSFSHNHTFRRSFGALSALFALLIVASTLPAAAQPSGGATITDVRFEGLEKLKADDLMGRIQSKPGTEYDPKMVREDLKRLARQAYRAEVRREETSGGVRLIFVLEENPTLSEIRIMGNSDIKTERLKKVTRLRAGDVLSRDAVREARDRVLKEYRSLGYRRAKVESDLARGADGGRVLQIVINEGHKMQVKDLLLLGNEYFSDIRLKAALETKGSWLFLKNYFDEAAFEEDLNTIRDLYQSKGFFDVKVERGSFLYDDNDKKVTPSVQITEGPRYVFGEALVQGNSVFTQEELEAPFHDLQGKPFDADSYSEALRKVHELYANAGFITTEISDEFKFDSDRGRVNALITIDENKRSEVGRILVERREQLSDEDKSWFGKIYSRVAPPVDNDVILKEVELKPGETYDKRLEEESVQRLRRLGVFKDVTIESRATDQPGVRDVLVRVEEGVTGNVFLGVGFSESFGAYAFGRYVERNFLGEAGDLRFDVMAGTRQINASVSYLRRYLADTRNSLYTEVHHFSARRPGFDETNTGLEVELGMPVDDYWKAYVGSRLQYVRVDEGTHDPDEDFNRDYPVATLGGRLAHNTLTRERLLAGDSVPSITGGHLGEVGLEAGYADGPLAKLTGRYEWYKKLNDKLVFTTDSGAGFMPVDADQIGPTERFYLGGTDDLRGFKYREAGPHDSGDDDVPLGGATKLLSRNELRYPLLDNITGLVFLDAGMLGHDVVEFDAPRASTGIGFRLALKGVEVGVDLAAPFLKEPDDQERYFHFRMSTLKGF